MAADSSWHQQSVAILNLTEFFTDASGPHITLAFWPTVLLSLYEASPVPLLTYFEIGYLLTMNVGNI